MTGDSKEEGRKIVLDILLKDIEEKKSRGIYYVLYHLDQWNLKVDLFPELLPYFEEKKQEILAGLAGTADNNETDWQTVTRLIKAGLDWPELDYWKKALEDHNLESIRRGLENLIPSTLAWMVDMEMNVNSDQQIKKLVDDAKPRILADLIAVIKEYQSHDPGTTSFDVKRNFNRLNKLGIRWPELSMLARRLESEIPGLVAQQAALSEMSMPNAYAAEILQELKKKIENDDLWNLVSVLEKIGYTINDDDIPNWSEFLQSHKMRIVKALLQHIEDEKEEKEANGEDVDWDWLLEDYTQAISVLQQMGARWPEFKVVLDGLKNRARQAKLDKRRLGEDSGPTTKTEMANSIFQSAKHSFSTTGLLLVQSFTRLIEEFEKQAIPHDIIVRVVADNQEMIYTWLDNSLAQCNLKYGYVSSMIEPCVEQAEAIVRILGDNSRVLPIVNKHKRRILEWILASMVLLENKRRDKLLIDLANIGINWPEITMINNKISALRNALRKKQS